LRQDWIALLLGVSLSHSCIFANSWSKYMDVRSLGPLRPVVT